MAVFLVAPDLRRLADVLLLNRRVAPAADPPALPAPWLQPRRAGLPHAARRSASPRRLLYGSYQASKEYGDPRRSRRCTASGTSRRSRWTGRSGRRSVTDETRWRRVVFDYPARSRIQLMSDSRVRYGLKLDEKKRLLTLTKPRRPEVEVHPLLQADRAGAPRPGGDA